MPVSQEVVSAFTFEGEFLSVEPIIRGNINDTYVALFQGDNGRNARYTIQRINHKVFKDPCRLMENVIAVTLHIRRKVAEQGGDPSRQTLHFIPLKDGGFTYCSSDGNFWRAYAFIDDVKTYQIVENPIHFYNAGRAFGRFQQYLSDFPASQLYETIPDFHHTARRYRAFQEAVEKDPAGRVKTVRHEIGLVEAWAGHLSVVTDNLGNEKIPIRVTHNDTKFNNVLIDNRTGEGICIIDLDTVMPGSSLYDFGDSIRSGANTASEEEKDLSKVGMDVGLYDQFARGFLEYTHAFLTPFEIGHLPFSAMLITMEQAIRFLGDYINGDTYYKTSYEGQNLNRALVQFKLFSDMDAKYDKMANITERYSS